MAMHSMCMVFGWLAVLFELVLLGIAIAWPRVRGKGLFIAAIALGLVTSLGFSLQSLPLNALNGDFADIQPAMTGFLLFLRLVCPGLLIGFAVTQLGRSDTTATGPYFPQSPHQPNPYGAPPQAPFQQPPGFPQPPGWQLPPGRP